MVGIENVSNAMRITNNNIQNSYATRLSLTFLPIWQDGDASLIWMGRCNAHAVKIYKWHRE